MGRFSFWKIKSLLTGVEGGAASGNERFALRAWIYGIFIRQRRQLIIAERGAPPKARLPDAHSSLFRRYAPYTCSKKKNVLMGRFSFWKIKSLLTGVEGGAASGNERFALRVWIYGIFIRQRRQLIIAERGAPSKARRPDAHSSLFRRYAPATCSN